MNLDDIDFLFVSWVSFSNAASETQNLPPLVDAVRLKPGAEDMPLQIEWRKYENVDDIIIINFKKIRERVNLAMEGNFFAETVIYYHITYNESTLISLCIQIPISAFRSGTLRSGRTISSFPFLRDDNGG
jgi:hypothetical protein